MKKLLCCKQTPQERYKMVLYKKGIDKIDKEMDIRLLSKNMRALKFIQGVLFSKSQRFLIPYFKERVLSEKEYLPKEN
jgi:hypothetical protein